MFLKSVSKKILRQPVAAVSRVNFSILDKFATIDPYNLSAEKPGKVWNLVDGQWTQAKQIKKVIDPLNGEVILETPATSLQQLDPFIKSLSKCPKSGLHNPFKNPERYLLYGSVMQKCSEALHNPEIFDFFSKLIQRFVPKSKAQSDAELRITRNFMENFTGDNVRFLAQAQSYPGDHTGQMTTSYRWPYGPVGVVSPFNFPIQIPTLQVMGALFMGNKVIYKPDSICSAPMEQLIRLLHACGMPPEDLDFISCKGSVMQKLLEKAPIRCTQFTGSSTTSQKLVAALEGKVKVEDAGYDWKLMGPDVSDLEYVAYMCDHDAYAFGGQKCSAQSAMFVHENWVKAGLLERVKQLAKRRKLQDLTITPVLSWNNQQIKEHIDKVMQMEGSEILFGGKELENHTIPQVYGSFEPTAIKVDLKHWKNKQKRKILSTELFGPFQIVTTYSSKQLETVLQTFESMSHHLTAAIVSNDVQFQNQVIGRTVNGTQYVGIRARTTGAPQNHWFGPAGDPRGAGIGTKQAIQLVWSCHREVVTDVGPVQEGFEAPPPV